MKDIVMNIEDLVTLIALVVFITGILTMCFIGHVHEKEKLYYKDGHEDKDEHIEDEDAVYEKPVLRKLSREEIEAIHKRGHITPEEQVKEWEDLDLCVPGDAIGSAGWRCKKFHNCHDCLVDYASDCDEYTSIFDIMQETKFSLHEDYPAGSVDDDGNERKKETEDGTKDDALILGQEDRHGQ